MARAAIVLRVLIASPSGVSDERDIIRNAIHEWNAVHSLTQQIVLEPLRWETHSYPASGERPQGIINKQIVADADAVIAIFGHRLGIPTKEEQSGTIEEIEEFRKHGKHISLYFFSGPVPRGADHEQLDALGRYQQQRRKDSLIYLYETLQDLHEAVARHLPSIVLSVIDKLRVSDETGRIEKELAQFGTLSEQRLSELVEEAVPLQLKHEFIGQFPDGPRLRLTARQDFTLARLDYLDENGAEIDSEVLNVRGQNVEVRIDHKKLVRINNLKHANGRPFPMKFRLELLLDGKPVEQVIPALVEQNYKNINNTQTYYMKLVA